MSIKFSEEEIQAEKQRILGDADLVVIPTSILLEWNIGFNKEDVKELSAVGLSRENLRAQIIASTTGNNTHEEYTWEFQGCDTIKIKPCIEINGKFIPLNDNEFDIFRLAVGVPQELQIEILQRLLLEKQVTWEDIENMNLYPDVYKVLVNNRKTGIDRQLKLLKELDKYEKLHDAKMEKYRAKNK